MPDYVTDTHGLVWYLEDSPRLGSAARQAYEACERGEGVIHIPTICLVELIYLQEKGRIPAEMLAQLYQELRVGPTGLIMANLTEKVARMVGSLPRRQVPDLPDRIIAATALHLGLPLLSRIGKFGFPM